MAALPRGSNARRIGGAGRGLIFALAFALCAACGGSTADDEDAGEGGADVAPADGIQPDGAEPDGEGPGETDGETDTDGEDVGEDDVGADAEGADANGEEGGPPPEIPPGTWAQFIPAQITKDDVLRGIWMSREATGHIVGASGVAVEFEDDAFEVVSEGVFPNLNAVWGTSQDDAWAVGIGGLMVRWDGEAWRKPGGCATSADCDDGDPCTQGTCDGEGACALAAVPGGPGCCGTPAFSEAWSGGELGGWEVASLYPPAPGGPQVGWQISDYIGPGGVPRQTIPPYSLYFGNPDAPCPGDPGSTCPNFDGGDVPVGGVATSPLFTVPFGPTVELRFDLWLDAELTAGFDDVSVSVVLGPAEVLLWSSTAVHSSFQPYTVDLTPYRGQPIRLRFRFDSVDEIENDGEGAYIDNITVTATCGPLPSGAGAGQVTKATLFDVWGPSPNQAYAVGLNGTVLQYDGSSWFPLEIGGGQSWSLNGLFGAGSTLVAVGEGGLALGGSGGSLQAQPTPVNTALQAVWAASANEVYAVGNSGVVLRRGSAGNWVQEPVGTGAALRGVWGAGSFTVIAVGDGGVVLRRVEGNWAPDPQITGVNLRAVWAQGTANVWAVGDSGVLLFDDGNGWQQPNSPTIANLHAVHGSSPSNVWAVGDNGAGLRYDGTSWEAMQMPGLQAWRAVWVAGPGQVYATTANGGIYVGGGDSGWTQMDNPFAPAPVRSIWGTSANDLYAAGEGFVLRYDGNEELVWRVYASTVQPVTWRGVCGSGPNNVLLVGAEGTIARWDGSNWAQVPIQPDPSEDPNADPVPVTELLYGCATLDPNRAWAVGSNGVVLELSGDKFVRGSNPIPISLRRVYAHDESLLFAVGIEGYIISSRGPGRPWVPMSSGTVAGLFGITGTTLDDITVVGDRGTILRFVPDPAAFAAADE